MASTSFITLITLLWRNSSSSVCFLESNTQTKHKIPDLIWPVLFSPLSGSPWANSTRLVARQYTINCQINGTVQTISNLRFRSLKSIRRKDHCGLKKWRTFKQKNVDYKVEKEEYIFDEKTQKENYFRGYKYRTVQRQEWTKFMLQQSICIMIGKNIGPKGRTRIRLLILRVL